LQPSRTVRIPHAAARSISLVATPDAGKTTPALLPDSYAATSACLWIYTHCRILRICSVLHKGYGWKTHIKIIEINALHGKMTILHGQNGT
jgi:hypothetical protein